MRSGGRERSRVNRAGKEENAGSDDDRSWPNSCFAAIPARFHVKNIHPATRVFQALRIEVNDELRRYESALAMPSSFSEGGRIMAISFHSLEDRIVKNAFRRLASRMHMRRGADALPLYGGPHGEDSNAKAGHSR